MTPLSTRPNLLRWTLLPLLAGALATAYALEIEPGDRDGNRNSGPGEAQAPAANSPSASKANPKTNSMQNALTRYQIALDQLAAGRTLEARVLLEDLAKREGDRPEWNILLASLLEREGKAARARQVLAKVQASPLARAYLSRLQNVADTDPADTDSPRASARASSAGRENIAAKAQPVASNPARSAAADARLVTLEKVMLEMVNRERDVRGLAPLLWSDDLADVARAHSVEMRDKQYFAHESPTPGLERPMNRYIAGIGTTPRIVAENIYRAWGTQHKLSREDIEAGHTSLMNSPGHKSNILLAQAERCGIGIAVNENGDIWLTQMFDRP